MINGVVVANLKPDFKVELEPNRTKHVCCCRTRSKTTIPRNIKHSQLQPTNPPLLRLLYFLKRCSRASLSSIQSNTFRWQCNRFVWQDWSWLLV